MSGHEQLEQQIGLMVAQGRYQEAQLALEAQVQDHPRCAQSHYLLGCLHQVRGHFADAVAEFRRAVFIDPSKPYYLFNLAAALHRTGHLTEALKFAAEAARRDPQNEQATRMVELLSQPGATLR